MSEIKSLLEQAVRDLVVFLKRVEAMVSWPPALKEMLYLQLPKEGAKNTAQRSPIDLLPQVYRFWLACCRADVLKWRQLCKDRGSQVANGRQHACECPQDCCVLQWLCDQTQALESLESRRFPPVQITTRDVGVGSDVGVDTQWFAWRNPVQQKRISSLRASMYRTRALGLPAYVKARIVKSLFSVGLYGAEVGGVSDQHMQDLRPSARGALDKGTSLRRSAALELMAHGGLLLTFLRSECGSDGLLLVRCSGPFLWLPWSEP
eukprot:516378-Amphidinium_carterae.1